MMRWRRALLVSLLVFCGSEGGIAQGSSHWLVSPELLRAGKLEILWQNELPMGKGESLERLLIVGNRIYALSDHNYIVSMNRENGNPVFSRPFAPAGFVVLGLELYNDKLISIIGNRLVELNPEFGTEHRGTRLAFGATCPAALNSSYFYLGGSDKRMHVLRSEDKVQVFEVAAESDSEIVSIVADEGFVVFGTDAGDVISIIWDAPRQLWEFHAADGIAWPIVKDTKSLFFASTDTNVYKLNLITGGLIWKYQTAGVLERGPRVTKDVVYQHVPNKGLTAIDKKSGAALWELSGGADLLAEAYGKAYVITNGRILVVMDNKKAKQLYSINFAGVTKYTANAADSKIYIANKAGKVACIKPIE